MAEMLNDLDSPSDAELISRVRGGDLDAYGQLFGRHVEAARRLARQLVRGPDSEDLVSDAFTKVMGALQKGGGPDIAFRAYLLTAVRRLHVDRVRAQSRITTSDDLTELDPGVPFQDTVVEQFENGAAARAFASLPERWQMVLWHLEVERQKPAEVAPLLGMTPNSVSALAYRAREGLRQAFLAAHLSQIGDTECRWVVDHLGGYVRKGLAKRDAGKVESHLEACRPCSARYLELVEVNNDLAGVLAPLLLGGLAAGYLTATAAGMAAGGGIVALLDRAKDFVAAHVVPVSAGATAAGVAAAVVVVGGVGPGGRPAEPRFEADTPPTRVVSTEAVDATDRDENSEGKAGGGPGSPGARTAPAGADASDGDAGAAPGPSSSVSAAPPAAAPPAGTPDEDRASVPDTAPDEQPTRTPTPTLTPTPTPTPSQPADDDADGDDEGDDEEEVEEARDIALSLTGKALPKAVGRFRAHVAKLPNSSEPTPLQFVVRFSTSDVHLESVPKGCSSSGSGSVSCTASGATYNGLFDADLSALSPGDEVTITVTVTIPSVADPDPTDNTRSITITRVGAGRILARR